MFGSGLQMHGLLAGTLQILPRPEEIQRVQLAVEKMCSKEVPLCVTILIATDIGTLLDLATLPKLQRAILDFAAHGS